MPTRWLVALALVLGTQQCCALRSTYIQSLSASALTRSFSCKPLQLCTTFQMPRACRTVVLAGSDGIAESVAAPGDANFGEFDWKKHWYPIAFDRFTDKDAPFAFTLLGERLVLWWDPVDSAWSAMRDVCPHRLAPLSEGRVNDKGDIECPYHGWSFEGKTGACTSIPQSSTPEKVSNDKRACGSALHTVLAQGIIWVWAAPIYPGQEEPSHSLIPVCQAFENEGVTTDDVSIDLPYDYTLLLENVMDMSHVPFTHHGTQGNRKFARPIHYKIKDPLKSSGFLIEWSSSIQSLTQSETPPTTANSPDSTTDTQTTDKQTIKPLPPAKTEFHAPSYQYHKLQLPGFTLWIVIYAVPTTPGQCRLLARFPVIRKTPTTDKSALKLNIKRQFQKPVFLQHMMRNQVFEDDNIFLHAQERELALRLGGHLHTDTALPGESTNEKTKPGAWTSSYYLATTSDTPVVLFRRWLDRTAPLPWSPGTPAAKYYDLTWEKERLLDRRKSHLNHCLPCQKAARMLKVGKGVVAGIAGALMVMCVSHTALMKFLLPSVSLLTKKLITYVLLAICGGAYVVIGQLQSRLVQGPYPPTRNLRNQR